MRYFNVGIKESEINLRCNLDNKTLESLLTKIFQDSIINEEDINYRINIYNNDQVIKTNIDYWISDIRDISTYMVKYDIMVDGSEHN